jgi:hypothetical protein
MDTTTATTIAAGPALSLLVHVHELSQVAVTKSCPALHDTCDVCCNETYRTSYVLLGVRVILYDAQTDSRWCML